MFLCNRGVKASVIVTIIWAVYRENVMRESIAQKLFSRFQECYFDIDGSLCSENPSNIERIHEDPNQIVGDLVTMSHVQKLGGMCLMFWMKTTKICLSADSSLLISSVSDCHWWRKMEHLRQRQKKMDLSRNTLCLLN